MNFRAIQDFPERFPQGALFPLQGARDPRTTLRGTLLVAPARPQAADFWCLGFSLSGKNGENIPVRISTTEWEALCPVSRAFPGLN
jgi:hypothetical protein